MKKLYDFIRQKISPESEIDKYEQKKKDLPLAI